MIDAQINKIIKPLLDTLAQKVLVYNIKPNSVTFIGFFFGLLCSYFIINEMFLKCNKSLVTILTKDKFKDFIILPILVKINL